MGQNPTDSHLEGKSPWRDSNLRPLAWSNNLLKVTLGGQLAQLHKHILLESSSTSTIPIVEKIDKIKRLIIDGKVTLLDDASKPLAKVDSSGDHDSEDEVASVDNEMANFLASKKSLGLIDEEDNDVTDDVSGGGKKWHVRELSDDFHRVGTKKRVMEIEGEARNRGRKVAITRTVQSGLKGGGMAESNYVYW
ncbi:hypothetical protein Tco_0078891 [Tanacetum coccineum]